MSSDDSEKDDECPTHTNTNSRSSQNLLTTRNDPPWYHWNASQSQKPLRSISLRMQGLMQSFVAHQRFRAIGGGSALYSESVQNGSGNVQRKYRRDAESNSSNVFSVTRFCIFQVTLNIARHTKNP